VAHLASGLHPRPNAGVLKRHACDRGVPVHAQLQSSRVAICDCWRKQASRSLTLMVTVKAILQRLGPVPTWQAAQSVAVLPNCPQLNNCYGSEEAAFSTGTVKKSMAKPLETQDHSALELFAPELIHESRRCSNLHTLPRILPEQKRYPQLFNAIEWDHDGPNQYGRTGTRVYIFF
jgi:hypothetical protein